MQTQHLHLLQDPACASLLSSPLVLPLIACDSDALSGADPCRKLLLQHHRASAPASTKKDHTYPVKVSHKHLPTAPSRAGVRQEDFAALCRSHCCAAKGVQMFPLCRDIASGQASGYAGVGAAVYFMLID